MRNGDFIKGELYNSEDNWNLCIKDAIILSKVLLKIISLKYSKNHFYLLEEIR